MERIVHKCNFTIIQNIKHINRHRILLLRYTLWALGGGRTSVKPDREENVEHLNGLCFAAASFPYVNLNQKMYDRYVPTRQYVFGSLMYSSAHSFNTPV